MGDVEKLMIFERKILRRIYGPIENGEYSIRTNKEIYQMYPTPNIYAFMKVKLWNGWDMSGGPMVY